MKLKFILSFLIFSIATVSFAEYPDSLWKRSYQVMQKNGLWLPGEAQVCEEVIDQKGKLQATECCEFEIQPDSDLEKLNIRKIKSSTGHNEPGMDEAMVDFLHNLGLGLPYFVAITDITVSARKEGKIVNGEKCEGFNFRAIGNKRNFAGVVWVETKTASPLLIEMRLNEVAPIKFRGVEIDHFYRTIELVNDNGKITAPRVITEAWVSNRSLFKRNLVVWRFTANLKSYWKSHWRVTVPGAS